MSVEQDDSASHVTERHRPISFDGPVEPSVRYDRSITESTHHPALLAARIERTRLSARIVALEQALEASERRRQAIIDQYERLLADWTAATEPSSRKSGSWSRSVLTRLFDR